MAATDPGQGFDFSYRIYPEHRCGVGQITGVLSGPQMIAVAAGVFNDPAWQPGFRMLWDDRGLTEMDLAPKEDLGVAAFLEVLRNRIGEGKMAVVMPREQLAATASKLVEMANLHQVRIFGDFEQAIAWAEVPSDLVRQLTQESQEERKP